MRHRDRRSASTRRTSLAFSVLLLAACVTAVALMFGARDAHVASAAAAAAARDRSACRSRTLALPCVGSLKTSIAFRLVVSPLAASAAQPRVSWLPDDTDALANLALAAPLIADAALELAGEGAWSGFFVALAHVGFSLQCTSLKAELALTEWQPLRDSRSSLASLATRASCALADNRRFLVSHCPHFCGGANLFRAYFSNLGWTPTTWQSSEPLTVLIVPCMLLLPSMAFWRNAEQRSAQLISAAPHERNYAVKRPFNRAVQRRLQGIGCSAAGLIPETHFVSVPEGCRAFVESAQRAGKGARWFLKSRIESFGDGITVVSSPEAALAAVGNCSAPRTVVSHSLTRARAGSGR